MIEQEGRICALEKEVKLLEDEMLRIREEGAAMTATAQSSNTDLNLQIETLRSQEKVLKAKVRARPWGSGDAPETASAVPHSNPDFEFCSVLLAVRFFRVTGNAYVGHIFCCKEPQ